jgi:hypothetical protein
MRFNPLIPSLLVSLACLTGCAHYEFDLVRPADLARHVGEDREQVLSVPPLEYHMQAYEGRLVLRIFNHTGEIIFLQGGKSSVGDPEGESHPLRDLTIVPDSWIKLILPPLRPQAEAYGPDVGFGFGVVGDRGDAFYPNFEGDPYYYDAPRSYSASPVGDSRFWEWDGQTDVRLILFFQRKSGDFHQEFTFHRRRM